MSGFGLVLVSGLSSGLGMDLIVCFGLNLDLCLAFGPRLDVTLGLGLKLFLGLALGRGRSLGLFLFLSEFFLLLDFWPGVEFRFLLSDVFLLLDLETGVCFWCFLLFCSSAVRFCIALPSFIQHRCP